jgi:hypothetical protein
VTGAVDLVTDLGLLGILGAGMVFGGAGYVIGRIGKAGK